MQAQRKKVHILKILGKSILGLLIVLMGLILFVHIPFVQRYITQQLPDYLSNRLGAKVEVKKISFSILGCIEVEGLKIWDPDDELILSLETFDLEGNFFSMMLGDFHVKRIMLSGINGSVSQNQDDVFNIQFLVDAFSDPNSPDTSSTNFSIQCDSLILQRIDFAFQSSDNQMQITSQLGSAFATNIKFTSNPSMVSIDVIEIDQNQLAIVTKSVKESDAVTNDPVARPFSFDFDPGIGVEIKALAINDNRFFFHADTVIESKKFDPNHLDVQRVDLVASNIQLLQNMVKLDLQQLMTQLPGFELDTGSATIEIDQQQFSISNLILQTHQSNVTGDFKSVYTDTTQRLPDLSLDTKGQLVLNDFLYFIPDSLESMFSHELPTAFDLALKSIDDGKESIQMNLRTAKSQLNVSGQLSTIWAPDKLTWKDLVLKSTIGSDLRPLLVSMLGESNLPPKEISLHMTSNGSLQKISVDGLVQTSWGNVDLKGDFIPVSSGIDLDIDVFSQNLMLADYLNSTWLGPADLAVSVNGSVGGEQNLQVEGLISSIEFSGKQIHQIQVDAHLFGDRLTTDLAISDSSYISQIQLAGDIGSPMSFLGHLQLDDFKLGELLSADSSLEISGAFAVDMTMAESSVMAHLDGTDLRVVNSHTNYALDSLIASAYLSDDSSYFNYQTDDGGLDLSANFDFRTSADVWGELSAQIMQGKDSSFSSVGSRTFSFYANLDDSGPLLLIGLEIDTFSSLKIEGSWEESERIINLKANTGLMSYLGMSYDTLEATINAKGSKINSTLTSENLFYGTRELGDLDFDILTKTDTSEANLRITYDSIMAFSLDTRMLMNQEGIAIFPSQLILYNEVYEMNSNGPLFVNRENATIDSLTIFRDDMKISLNGDLNKFNLDLSNLNLENLDPILFPDSTVIDSGRLNGKMSFIPGQHLDLDMHINNLILLKSSPLAIDIHAETENGVVPFDFHLSNGDSNISAEGKYGLQQDELAAKVLINVDSLEVFMFFFKDYLEYAKGAMYGEANISGPLMKPDFSGYLQFHDIGFSTKNPQLSFTVQDDSLHFNNEGLVLDDFVIFDNLNNPLYVSGSITNDDYKSVAYDVNIKTDHYALINRPESTRDNLNGLLLLGADINLRGNGKDTYVTADILVKDSTKLFLTLPDKENELINTKGIIEFVDPGKLLDTTTLVQQQSVYDSLLASLPDFTLSSKITIEQNAGLRINIDPQSGDYFRVTGSANLDLDYDRTGNPVLNGTYVVTEGVYSLSFYNLVKKDFDLIKGSSINWAGGPEDGLLDIKAVYSIKSNSIGLVGDEVSDNEKSVYKKSLDYEVGINIGGTIEKPKISFSLDLPEADKLTYPALANKLSRLQLPEFQSELNKQVFGLLVLGSFLPESSDADGSQGDIATTALYNSVNSLLAGQLNKLAGQYIKGINIDVGLQSYSDNSSAGGQTKTSMDFHLSTSLMDDRLVFEIGGDFDLNSDQSGANQGKSYRGDVAIIYDLTGNGDKKLKLFNNESYDIIYQEIRNTGISLIFVREFNKGEIKEKKNK